MDDIDLADLQDLLDMHEPQDCTPWHWLFWFVLMWF